MTHPHDARRDDCADAVADGGLITPDLFSDFNGIPIGVDKTELYQHDQNWSNRMILGDSLQVMASHDVVMRWEQVGLTARLAATAGRPPASSRTSA